MTEQDVDVRTRRADRAVPRGRIVLGGAAVAAGGAMAQIQLHEYAHAVAAIALTGSATVHSALVEHPDVPVADEALIAIAGPAFSLVLGVLVYAATRGLPSGLLRAFLTWFALSGLQGSFGYLMIAAVVPVGDTAVAFDAWGVPLAGYVAAGLVGLGGMFLNASLLCREITRSFSEPSDIVAAAVWTWLAATGVLVVVYGIAAAASGLDGQLLVATTIGPVTALVFAPMATFFWKRTPHRHLPWSVSSGPALVLVLVLAAIVLLHALAPITYGG